MKDIIFGKKLANEDEESNRTIALENREIIKAQLRKLMKMSQKNFSYYQIGLDPIKGKIPKGEEEEIIENSIFCGDSEAKNLKEKYSDLSICGLAKSLGINVEYKDKQGALDFVYFGLFESPNKIFIYDGNIKEAVSLLKELKIHDFHVDFRDIVLAHEIFHFIEEHDKSLYTNTRRIKLWSLGRIYTHTSNLICTGEIAAMSFSKTLLNLDFDPNILDYIFLAAFDFEKADKLFHRMIKYD